MPSVIRVHFLPAFVRPDELFGATVVMIDVLRASTTIASAVAAGAQAVIPCAEIDNARRIAESFDSDQAMLGGERDGVRIEGFDLGNSPGEYSAEKVSGRTIVFTTTNGTRALAAAREAQQILIGALVNVAAVAARLRALDNVHLLCAGTRGEVSGEDTLAAGAMVEQLSRQTRAAWELDDAARIARDTWIAVAGDAATRPAARELWPQLESALRQTAGGRNVRDVGLAGDIELCARLDCLDCVPTLDRATGAIVLR